MRTQNKRQKVAEWGEKSRHMTELSVEKGKWWLNKIEKPDSTLTKKGEHEAQREHKTLSLNKKGRGEDMEQWEPESQRIYKKELGHPIFAFTIAHVLPEAHCPLTVGLCERARHSLSYYTASPTHKPRKEPGCMWVRWRGRRGWRGEMYSMIYTKPLEEHGHHVECCGETHWYGECSHD